MDARILGDLSRPVLTRDQVLAAARSLDQAEKTREQIPLLSEACPAMTMADAYEIQAAWASMKEAAGDPRIGWKIGLTSKAMQAALDINIPDSGVLLGSMRLACGETVPAGRFIQPRIEAELAFVMARDVEPDASPDAILAATDYVAPALEILDTRITRKDPVTGRGRTVLDTIADNAANAGVVLGQAHRGLSREQLRWAGAIVTRDDEVEETGLGAGVLGDPLLSMSWLARRLGAYGEQIKAGQIVLSGSFIRPIEAPPGSRISADFGPLGLVELCFD
ncbi:2-oxo-hepta-3-ene-1,7-dioic acid hydratase [Sphingosinicella sp. LY1275]|uniref:2-oxo-hepta-3-ene-1,7-dioic acid hydratase n=1 Tax=Sphingosinicella sp. LY1275 TaxID=3095379 RepID=UPI002ADED94B|nr:2-oxo-hepta-3-ene-1,7-dioic acid hydratase [Sphingosinicella sp. LY1275]MEA1015743.1 2-oxo-hepta-3-ene-1,7-dioic acid hydratase [Sphingosinicella sp. LY1275]